MNLFSKFINKKILLFFIVFCITFFITYIYSPLGYDEVWTYGFSYNITKGLTLYKDFSVVTTPLYYFIGSVFIKIFGNHIISTQIFDAILISSMFLLMFKHIKWKSCIVLSLILLKFPNSYTLFSLFWLMLIIYIIDEEKYNDTLIGIIIGLSFITKQNVGVLLLIPYLYFSKNKLKSIVIFLIPFTLVSIYLILNNAFYEFIDCCFLGLFEFGTKNYHFDINDLIQIAIIVYLFFILAKSKFKNKEIFYILMFQFVVFPLSDDRHLLTAFFPVLYYSIKKIYKPLILVLIFLIINMINFNNFYYINLNIQTEKNIFFLKNVNSDLNNLMHVFHDYLEEINVENYFFINYYAYLYKLYYDIPINRYDLWNEGNLGYNGIQKRLKEVDKICNHNKCIFIVNSDLQFDKTSQLKKTYNYVVTNYQIIFKNDKFIVYSN